MGNQSQPTSSLYRAISVERKGMRMAIDLLAVLFRGTHTAQCNDDGEGFLLL
jgi:hypothetical protein